MRRLENVSRSFISSRKTLNSNFIAVKKFPGLFQKFLGFFSFPGLEYYLTIFMAFEVSQGAWEPGMEVSSISRGFGWQTHKNNPNTTFLVIFLVWQGLPGINLQLSEFFPSSTGNEATFSRFPLFKFWITVSPKTPCINYMQYP